MLLEKVAKEALEMPENVAVSQFVYWLIGQIGCEGKAVIKRDSRFGGEAIVWDAEAYLESNYREKTDFECFTVTDKVKLVLTYTYRNEIYAFGYESFENLLKNGFDDCIIFKTLGGYLYATYEDTVDHYKSYWEDDVERPLYSKDVVKNAFPYLIHGMGVLDMARVMARESRALEMAAE